MKQGQLCLLLFLFCIHVAVSRAATYCVTIPGGQQALVANHFGGTLQVTPGGLASVTFAKYNFGLTIYTYDDLHLQWSPGYPFDNPGEGLVVFNPGPGSAMVCSTGTSSTGAALQLPQG